MNPVSHAPAWDTTASPRRMPASFLAIMLDDKEKAKAGAANRQKFQRGLHTVIITPPPTVHPYAQPHHRDQAQNPTKDQTCHEENEDLRTAIQHRLESFCRYLTLIAPLTAQENDRLAPAAASNCAFRNNQTKRFLHRYLVSSYRTSYCIIQRNTNSFSHT